MFFRLFKKKKDKQIVESENPTVIEHVKVEPGFNESPRLESKFVEQKPQSDEHRAKIEKTSQAKSAVSQKPEDVNVVKTEKKKDESKVLDKNAKPVKYHVSQNKNPKSDMFKKWRVRKEGSDKTIKFFDTQKEAIDYAQELADKAKSSIVIHKLDGKIRKQDYDKK